MAAEKKVKIKINGKIYTKPENERAAFTFFRTFIEAVEADTGATDTEKLNFLLALVHYALDMEEPDKDKFSELGRFMWKIIIPNVDSGLISFLKGSKGREDGIKGGAPKGSRNNPNGRKGGDATRHTPPKSLQEVQNYCDANSIDMDCERFFDYWEDKKWEWRNPAVKTWQDCVKNWAKMEAKFGKN